MMSIGASGRRAGDVCSPILGQRGDGGIHCDGLGKEAVLERMRG